MSYVTSVLYDIVRPILWNEKFYHIVYDIVYDIVCDIVCNISNWQLYNLIKLRLPGPAPAIAPGNSDDDQDQDWNSDDQRGFEDQ